MATHPTLSDEQIDMIAFHTERAARKALRAYVRGATVAFIILLIGVGLVFYEYKQARKAVIQSGSVIAVDGCNRDFRTIGTLRGVLESARANQHAAFRAGEITSERLRAFDVFYDEQLRLLRQPDCREAMEILTDNPSGLPRVPVPLHSDSG